MKYAYLDWNVLDRIEKIESLNEEQYIIFAKMELLISENNIICPYSNAHINDLLRGYLKNPSYIPNHLETIKRLTNNLCIVQYWGNPQTTWHYRSIHEFFNSALEDKEMSTESFSDFIAIDEAVLFKKLFEKFRLIPIHSNFKEIYLASPVFNLIFPRTKTEMTFLSLCEDFYSFSNNIKKDYSLYKSFKAYLNQAQSKLKHQIKMVKQIEKINLQNPTYLNFDEAWDKYSPKSKTSDNPVYQKITDTYFKLDFKGYKSDDKFSNLIDDSLHVFYGAHCDYFVTIDDKCYYKANETYQKLGIATKAMKPAEFVNCMSE